MSIEDVKSIIQKKIDDMKDIQESLARDGVPFSGWSFGYITGLNQILEELTEYENQEQE